MSDPAGYVEVDAGYVPPSTRRLAERTLRRVADGAPRTLRWFRSVGASDMAGLREVFASLAADDGHAFVSDEGLGGCVMATAPSEMWVNADLSITEVERIVRHEAEHSRMLELTGPSRSDAEHEAHELAAEVASRGGWGR